MMYAQNDRKEAFTLPWRIVWSHLMSGKSLTRTALNWWVQNHVKLSGKICDVGGGSNPSYSQFVGNRSGWIILDMDNRVKPSVAAMLQALPFQSEAFDGLCCFNVLEHVYETEGSVLEIFRVLKRGGQAFIFVPFLINIHTDPYDYHRYTAAALDKLLFKAGFARIEVTVFFGLCSSLLNLGLVLIPFRLMRAFLALGAMVLDGLLHRAKPDLVQRYVIGYGIRAHKQ